MIVKLGSQDLFGNCCCWCCSLMLLLTHWAICFVFTLLSSHCNTWEITLCASACRKSQCLPVVAYANTWWYLEKDSCCLKLSCWATVQTFTRWQCPVQTTVKIFTNWHCPVQARWKTLSRLTLSWFVDGQVNDWQCPVQALFQLDTISSRQNALMDNVLSSQVWRDSLTWLVSVQLAECHWLHLFCSGNCEATCGEEFQLHCSALYLHSGLLPLGYPGFCRWGLKATSGFLEPELSLWSNPPQTHCLARPMQS